MFEMNELVEINKNNEIAEILLKYSNLDNRIKELNPKITKLRKDRKIQYNLIIEHLKRNDKPGITYNNEVFYVKKAQGRKKPKKEELEVYLSDILSKHGTVDTLSDVTKIMNFSKGVIFETEKLKVVPMTTL
jgi:hypothetical protein